MKTITLILAAFCAVSAFAQTKTDPLDSQLKEVYRNTRNELKGPPSQYAPRGQHIVEKSIYTVTLIRKLSDTSGVFSVTRDYSTRGNYARDNYDRRSTLPDIVIINRKSIADMAKGDSIELNEKQTLWGLGTVTVRGFGTLRQFSFRRKDALAYIAAKKTANHTETCPTCGRPMPKNY